MDENILTDNQQLSIKKPSKKYDRLRISAIILSITPLATSTLIYLYQYLIFLFASTKHIQFISDEGLHVGNFEYAKQVIYNAFITNLVSVIVTSIHVISIERISECLSKLRATRTLDIGSLLAIMTPLATMIQIQQESSPNPFQILQIYSITIILLVTAGTMLSDPISKLYYCYCSPFVHQIILEINVLFPSKAELEGILKPFALSEFMKNELDEFQRITCESKISPDIIYASYFGGSNLFAYTYISWSNIYIVLPAKFAKLFKNTKPLLALICHEISHVVNNDCFYNFIFYLSRIIFPAIVGSFIFYKYRTKYPVLVLMVYILGIQQFVFFTVSSAINLMRRRQEYTADAMAVHFEYGEELIGAFKTLFQSYYTENLTLSPLLSIKYAHPSYKQRFDRIRTLLKK